MRNVQIWGNHNALQMFTVMMKKKWKAGIRASQESAWFTEFVNGDGVQSFRDKHAELEAE